MKYVNNALIEGEKPLHVGKFHWTQDAKAVLCLICFSWVFGIGIYFFLHFLLQRYSTEMVVTNRRLFYKTGVVARRVTEINIDRVESCIVNQSVLGRMLGYGSIVVRGTGIGEIDLPVIDAPVAFRKALDEAKEFNVQSTERLKREA